MNFAPIAFGALTSVALLCCAFGFQNGPVWLSDGTSSTNAVLGFRDDRDCPPVDKQIVAGANLTVAERELLPDICWRAETHPIGVRNGVRNAIPAGVDCTETQWCDSDGVCSVVCARGSVKVEPWLSFAINTQMTLARRLPLCYYNMLGTHNSAITIADGFGNLDEFFEQYLQWIKWAGGTHIQTNNHWLSITDQLNLGVRNVEVDVHWVKGDLRIAHCGGSKIVIFDKLIDAINLVAKLVGAKIRWDTETIGCNPSLSSIPAGDQRTFRDTIQEIAAWHAQPGNDKEFLIIYLDNQMDLKTWGLVPQLVSELLQFYPVETLFTPTDKVALGGAWPTPQWMLEHGKKAMVVSGADYGTEMNATFFARFDPGTCDWYEPELYQVRGVPQCSVFDPAAQAELPMLAGRLYRINTCELMYGPLNCDFVFHGVDGPLLNEESIPSVVDCGINMPCPDSLTPGRAASAVWTWAPGHPMMSTTSSSPTPTSSAWNHVWTTLYTWLQAITGWALGDQELCAVMSAEDGRWRSVPCGQDLPTACRSLSLVKNSTTWVLNSGPRGSCPDGYTHSVPIHPADNLQLLLLLQQTSLTLNAWLPITGPKWEV